MRSRPTRSRSALARLHAEATATLDEISATSRRRLPAWLDAVHAALERWGVLAQLRDDDAGRQALGALGLDPPLAPARRASLADGVEPLTLAEFTRWADDVLERVAYRPPIAATADGRHRRRRMSLPDVVVTPLARTILRPFAAVVMPGADHRSLGAMPVDDSLLPRSVAAVLSLPTSADRRDTELLAFAQVLRLPRVTISRRRGDAGDPVAASPFVERLRSALADLRMPEGGPGDLRAWRDPRGERRFAAEPVRPTAPAVPQRPCRHGCPRAGSRPCAPARIASSPSACFICPSSTSSTTRSRSATTARGCTTCSTVSSPARRAAICG
jgi:ATP-dependent helicase/nuclease subunit B